MDTPRPLDTDLAARPIEGQGLGGSDTIGALFDRHPGPTVLVFLRHYG